MIDAGLDHYSIHMQNVHRYHVNNSACYDRTLISENIIPINLPTSLAGGQKIFHTYT